MEHIRFSISSSLPSSKSHFFVASPASLVVAPFSNPIIEPAWRVLENSVISHAASSRTARLTRNSYWCLSRSNETMLTSEVEILVSPSSYSGEAES